MSRFARGFLLGTLLLSVVLGLTLSVSLVAQDQSEACGALRIISGGSEMISAFRWTPLAAADEYKVNLYGSDGNIVASRWIKAPATSIDLNMGNFATGGSFQWEVEALQNGAKLCVTQRTAMISKPGDPNPPKNNPPTPLPSPTPIPTKTPMPL
jgi:hypothetical protein